MNYQIFTTLENGRNVICVQKPGLNGEKCVLALSLGPVAFKEFCFCMYFVLVLPIRYFIRNTSDKWQPKNSLLMTFLCSFMCSTKFSWFLLFDRLFHECTCIEIGLVLESKTVPHNLDGQSELRIQALLFFFQHIALIGHANEYLTSHYFGNPRHTQSMITYMYMILTEYSWKFQKKMQCGNVVYMPNFKMEKEPSMRAVHL